MLEDPSHMWGCQDFHQDKVSQRISGSVFAAGTAIFIILFSGQSTSLSLFSGQSTFLSLLFSLEGEVCRTLSRVCSTHVQGYLAHKKILTPLGPPQDPTHRPTAGSKGGVVSYERGTPER